MGFNGYVNPRQPIIFAGIRAPASQYVRNYAHVFGVCTHMLFLEGRGGETGSGGMMFRGQGANGAPC